MKKFWILLIFAAAPMVVNVGQAGVNHFGKHVHLANDTIGKADTSYTDWINVAEYPILGIMCRTKNPADSTVYRLSFQAAYDSSGTTYVYCDTAGAALSTDALFNIDDSASTWRAITISNYDLTAPSGCIAAHFVRLKLITHATNQGNRCAFWLYTFSWRPLRE